MPRLSEIIQFAGAACQVLRGLTIAGRQTDDGRIPLCLEHDFEVTSLESDSRKCSPGCCFVALKGTRADGLDFIEQAQNAGAEAVLCWHVPDTEQLERVRVPCILFYPQEMPLGTLAAWFYGNPSARLRLVGVTGTNGKSTVASLTAQWLSLVTGRRVGLVGTLGWGYLPDLRKSANTTPDAIELQKILARMVEDGTQYAVMEVSSIGVAEGRVDGCQFDAGAFTNLTRDHLDYHQTMENYEAAKLDFLHRVRDERVALFCASDPDCARLMKFSSPTFCAIDEEKSGEEILIKRYVLINRVSYERDGATLAIQTHMGNFAGKFRLLGRFNLENLTVAAALMLYLNIPVKKLAATLGSLRPVKGRMELFSARDRPAVVVDYAHTPDGVEKVLKGIRLHHPEGRIWCVLGCGGDRDRGKRPLMAIKACVYADKAVFTSDNPRSEDPLSIIDDMVRGLDQAGNYVVIPDRLQAISYAFRHAGRDDCVVLAGKGHEDYQILKDKTIHYSDRETACALLGVKLDQI